MGTSGTGGSVGSEVATLAGLLRMVGAGFAVSTVKARTAGDGSRAPALRARTRNLCKPSLSPENRLGETQGDHALPSNLHWKVARRTLEANRKVANGLVVSAGGPALIEVFGGVGAADVADGRIAPVTRTAARNR